MSQKLMLHIPDHDPIMCGDPLTLSYAPREVRVESMTYYMRRGNKYFFRGLVGKLAMTDPIFNDGVKLKRGETYQMKMSFKDEPQTSHDNVHAQIRTE